MWTTSSSRADLVLAAAIVASACAGPPAPDSPAAARRMPAAAVAVVQTPQRPEPVELRSVTVTRLDTKVEPWSREEGLQKAREPLLVEVVVARPLDPAAVDSYPLIVWNEQKLHRTRIVPGSPDRLQAYLVDRREVRERNTVHVQWEGREELTKSRQPLVVRADEIR
ncbi:MAG: hypothetical protein U1E73_11880 [Planctomycetota bacterium]